MIIKRRIPLRSASFFYPEAGYSICDYKTICYTEIMSLSLILAIVAGVLLIVGFAGTFVPVLPGAPLAWAGLLAAYFSDYCSLSIAGLIITAVCAVFVSVFDNILPVVMTKKFGGSKYAVTGSTVGLIIGFFVGPAGMILGPFIGALVGELIYRHGNFDGVSRRLSVPLPASLPVRVLK